MIRCSISLCKELPITVCNSCKGIFFCSECSNNHYKKHQEEGSPCSLEKINFNFSKANFKRLRQRISESIKIIERQKNLIIKEALNAHNQVEILMRSAFFKLNKMIEEYSRLYKQGIHESWALRKVQKIMREETVFEYPSFSIIEGVLDKNTTKIKNNRKKFVQHHLNRNSAFC